MTTERRMLVVVGSLTRATPYFEKAHGAGLSVLAFDPHDEHLTLLSTIDGIDNPTHLSVDPSRSTVYAVSEVFGWNEGTVSAYRLDTATGSLAYLNKQATLGSLAAHTAFSRHRSHLFVTNYRHEISPETPGRAMVALPILPDGGLGPASSGLVHVGRGPREDRQAVPHPHSTVASVDGATIWVADLGLDRLFRHRFDETTGRIDETPVETLVLPPGSGPRHFVEAAGGAIVHVLDELTSTLATFSNRDRTGWKLADLRSTLPSNHHGINLCAAIAIATDGHCLYASNRGHDSVVRFTLDPITGIPVASDHVLSGGRTPRSFALTPTGEHLLVANQNSDEIVVFRRAPDGGLHDVGSRFSIGTPMCLQAFFPEGPLERFPT